MFTSWRHHWNQLPRDPRDTLFLLGVIAWVLLPQLAHLPLWCSALVAVVLTWRGWLAWRGRALPTRAWLVLMLLATLLATWLTYRTLLGRDAGVTLIVVLLTLKTLELRARRDAFVVFFLGFFTLLTNFFYSQSLLTAVAMLVALLGLLTALVNAHLPVGKPPLLSSAKTAGSLALWGTPVMIVLFVLFPRMAPLWGLPGDSMSGRSGLSSSMQVGTIASLALDDSIALRVRFEGAPPRQSELYFRGPVLSIFDGQTWQSRVAARPAAPSGLQVDGPPVRYQLTLEPHQRRWLLALDAMPDAPDLNGRKATMTPELQWQIDRPVTDLLRYSAQSYPSFRHGPLTRVPALQDDLGLPASYNPRTLQLAAQLRAGPAGTDAPALVNAVLDRLRTGNYRYTLEPGLYGRHSADEFWFDRKEGFCEHIASSFVILMRAMDIPARVVTGYQGGELNALDGHWVVRQRDAHAWTEVWLSGQGWVRVDPTSAVAPGRTGTLQRLEVARGPIASALLGTLHPAFALNMRAAWDALNNQWNQWVLNYTQGRQLQLLESLGFDSPQWEDLLTLLFGAVAALSLGVAAWAHYERRRQDPWLRLLGACTQRLQHLGLPVARHSPPRRLARQCEEHFGAQHPGVTALCDWLHQLEQQRYAPSASPAHRANQLATLKRQFNRLLWPK